MDGKDPRGEDADRESGPPPPPPPPAPTGVPPSSPRGLHEEPCRNCGDPTGGAFCSRCGQRKVEVQVSLKVLLQEVAREQLGLEGRLPRTLRALFLQPGRLTRDYLEGRVERYIRPFKLYLVSSLLLFLLVGLLSMRGVTTVEAGAAGLQSAQVDSIRAEVAERIREARESGADRADLDELEARLERLVESPGGLGGLFGIPSPTPPATAQGDPSRGSSPVPPVDPEEGQDGEATDEAWYERVRVNTGNATVDALLRARIQRLGRMDPADAVREVVRTFLNHLPTLMFLLLPVFAGILKLLYIRHPRFYVEHFVFVLHTHSFVFGIFTLALLAGWAGVGFLPPLLLLWALVYLYLALRRVYGQSHLRTALKYWSLGWLYFWTLLVALPPLVVLTLLLAGG